MGEADLAQLRDELTFQIGDAAARTANAVIDRFGDMFRLADDRTGSVADRVTVLERRLDEHVEDRSAHGRTRKSRPARRQLVSD